MFIHPKIAGSVPDVSPIECLLTRLAADMAKAESHGTSSASASADKRGPSTNGQIASDSDRPEALVQTITDQVMRALNGTGYASAGIRSAK